MSCQYCLPNNQPHTIMSPGRGLLCAHGGPCKNHPHKERVDHKYTTICAKNKQQTLANSEQQRRSSSMITQYMPTYPKHTTHTCILMQVWQQASMAQLRGTCCNQTAHSNGCSTKNTKMVQHTYMEQHTVVHLIPKPNSSAPVEWTPSCCNLTCCCCQLLPCDL